MCSVASSTKASSIRDLKSILQALGDEGASCEDAVMLTEGCALRCHLRSPMRLRALENRLQVILLDR